MAPQNVVLLYNPHEKTEPIEIQLTFRHQMYSLIIAAAVSTRWIWEELRIAFVASCSRGCSSIGFAVSVPPSFRTTSKAVGSQYAATNASG